MCEEKDLLVSFLYNDLGNADRARFEHHLRRCTECRDELHALQGVRADLTAWAPPASELGFRIVQDPKVVALTPRRAEWRGWWTPAAGLAAAAVLVLAAASAIAHVEIHRGPDGVTVRTGWSAAAPVNNQGGVSANNAPRAADATLSPASVSTAAIDPALVNAIVRRLDALEASSRASNGVRNAATMSAQAS